MMDIEMKWYTIAIRGTVETEQSELHSGNTCKILCIDRMAYGNIYVCDISSPVHLINSLARNAKKYY